MDVPKNAKMLLTLSEGRMLLHVDPTTIETKAEAETFIALVQQFAVSLPENKPRQRKVKGKKTTSSRQTASRRKVNGDVETETAEAN